MPGATSSAWISSSLLADLSVMEKRIERLKAAGHHGTAAERDANDRELELLERLHGPLTDGKPLRGEKLRQRRRSRSAASAS
jgi:hypothetical protein